MRPPFCSCPRVRRVTFSTDNQLRIKPTMPIFKNTKRCLYPSCESFDISIDFIFLIVLQRASKTMEGIRSTQDRLLWAGGLIVATTIFYTVGLFVYRYFFHPLAKFPGPILNAISDVSTKFSLFGICISDVSGRCPRSSGYCEADYPWKRRKSTTNTAL